jgi:hypothetical protein
MRNMPAQSLYAQLLSERYALLPPAVQRFHALQGEYSLSGRVRVEAAPTAAGRVLAWFLGAPTRSTEGAIHFSLDATAQREIWIRHFPGATMRSVLALEGGSLCERLGITTLSFQLDATTDRLSMRLTGMRVLGIPCPAFLRPRVLAEETEQDGRFHFEIRTAMPIVGAVIAYIGHLDLPR